MQIESRVTCPEDDLIGKMDIRLEIFWNIAFGLMILTAVCGNCAVLWIVFRKLFLFVSHSSHIIYAENRKMQTVTNLFIFNLCVADLINTIFNSTFNFVFMKNK